MKQEAEKYTVSPLLFIPKPGKTINKQQLLIQLYGQNREFKYQIKLNSELDTPFYRERNFRFSKFKNVFILIFFFFKDFLLPYMIIKITKSAIPTEFP